MMGVECTERAIWGQNMSREQRRAFRLASLEGTLHDEFLAQTHSYSHVLLVRLCWLGCDQCRASDLWTQRGRLSVVSALAIAQGDRPIELPSSCTRLVARARTWPLRI